MSRALLVCLSVTFSLCFVALFAIPVLASVTVSSTSVSFGSVDVNTSSAPATLVITNTNRHSVTLENISSSAPQFVVGSISLPYTLDPHASVSFSIVFQPAAAQSFSGTIQISFAGRAGSGSDTISVTGTGVQPLITLTPSSAAFGNVTTGVTNTQTFTIANPGTANLSVKQVSVSGAGFAYSGLVSPLTIAPGASVPFTVSFRPTSATSFSGTLTLANNSPNPSVTASLSGSGVAPILQLSASPISVGFGNVTTGTHAAQTVTLTNSGNAQVSLNGDSINGAGFSVAGLALPLALDAGQSTSFSVDFAPTTTGSASGSLSIASTATNTPTNIALSGAGIAPATHTVTLSWTPSSSSFSGFNVYRSTVSGGPYTKSDVSLITSETYTDSNVTSGQTYYYVATEIDTSGNESAYSTQVSATIP